MKQRYPFMYIEIHGSCINNNKISSLFKSERLQNKSITVAIANRNRTWTNEFSIQRRRMSEAKGET
jgi:hypothetical protein